MNLTVFYIFDKDNKIIYKHRRFYPFNTRCVSKDFYDWNKKSHSRVVVRDYRRFYISRSFKIMVCEELRHIDRLLMTEIWNHLLYK